MASEQKVNEIVKFATWDRFVGDKAIGFCYLCGLQIHIKDFDVAVLEFKDDKQTTVEHCRTVCRYCGEKSAGLNINLLKSIVRLEPNGGPIRRHATRPHTGNLKVKTYAEVMAAKKAEREKTDQSAGGGGGSGNSGESTGFVPVAPVTGNQSFESLPPPFGTYAGNTGSFGSFDAAFSKNTPVFESAPMTDK